MTGEIIIIYIFIGLSLVYETNIRNILLNYIGIIITISIILNYEYIETAYLAYIIIIIYGSAIAILFGYVIMGEPEQKLDKSKKGIIITIISIIIITLLNKDTTINHTYYNIPNIEPLELKIDRIGSEIYNSMYGIKQIIISIVIITIGLVGILYII